MISISYVSSAVLLAGLVTAAPAWRHTDVAPELDDRQLEPTDNLLEGHVVPYFIFSPSTSFTFRPPLAIHVLNLEGDMSEEMVINDETTVHSPFKTDIGPNADCIRHQESIITVKASAGSSLGLDDDYCV